MPAVEFCFDATQTSVCGACLAEEGKECDRDWGKLTCSAVAYSCRPSIRRG
jgi:hypothetical protein